MVTRYLIILISVTNMTSLGPTIEVDLYIFMVVKLLMLK